MTFKPGSPGVVSERGILFRILEILEAVLGKAGGISPETKTIDFCRLAHNSIPFTKIHGEIPDKLLRMTILLKHFPIGL